jgi:hypothetical protein
MTWVTACLFYLKGENMSAIANLEILQKFETDGITYGIYWADFDGKKKLFIQNGNSVGVVCHLYGKPADKCVCIVRQDVVEALRMLIAQSV